MNDFISKLRKDPYILIGLVVVIIVIGITTSGLMKNSVKSDNTEFLMEVVYVTHTVVDIIESTWPDEQITTELAAGMAAKRNQLNLQDAIDVIKPWSYNRKPEIATAAKAIISSLVIMNEAWVDIEESLSTNLIQLRSSSLAIFEHELKTFAGGGLPHDGPIFDLTSEERNKLNDFINMLFVE